MCSAKKPLSERQQVAVIALYIVGAVVLTFTASLTLNLAINGIDAVIDITPRMSEQRRTTGALMPCLVGWLVLVGMWYLRRKLLSTAR